MNTQEIGALLSPHVRDFLGVYSADTLPDVPVNFSLVMNLDVAAEPGLFFFVHENIAGSHWVALIGRREYLFFHDSFGRRPTSRHLLEWIKKHGFRRVIYSESRSQTRDERTCGGYAVYVITRVSGRGESFGSVVRRLRRRREDDKFIRQYLWKEHAFRLS